MAKMDFSFNWFDLCVLALLIVGIVVGRKRGMSVELLSVLQWLVIVVVADVTFTKPRGGTASTATPARLAATSG